MKGQLISICGVGRSGKDTFFTLLKTHLSNKEVIRYAFADALKTELDPLFKAFGGTAFETDSAKKELIRPILVSHGCSQRTLNPNHWIEKINNVVQEDLINGKTVVITDNRFLNEIEWSKSLGAKVVYIERILPDGTILPPINKEEAANDPVLRANADIIVSWPTEPEIQKLWTYVEKAAKELGL